MLKLALFDLDNTLLLGDSDHTWGTFLAEIGAVNANEQMKAQDYFYAQYQAGTLDIHEFLEFQFTSLKNNSMEQLNAWREQYIESHIKPMISQKRIDLVQQHKQQGHETIIITATNSFVTRPIATLFGIEHLIATEPERNIHGFTGKLDGIPCFQSGKIEKLTDFLSENFSGTTLDNAETWFYSDSHNDLPLLEAATHAIAVTPDEKLSKHANKHNWEIIQ